MPLDNVNNIVLVLSGKGGVGKSSITTQLALSLSLAGHSVGILDVDLTGPSIPRLFGLETAKITQAPGGWLPVQVHQSQILPPIPPLIPDVATNGAIGPIGSLQLMSLGFLLPSRSSAVVWRGPKKTAMVRQFLTDVLWPPGLDYLLIDTPPGTSDEHISLAETLLKVAVSVPPTPGANGVKRRPRLAGAVIVTTPQAVATSDVRKELNFCTKVGIEVLGIVENMSGYVCECCGVSTNLFGKGGGQIMSQDFRIQFLGSVPIDRQWGVLVEEGRRPVYGGVTKDEMKEVDDSDDEGDDVQDEDTVAMDGMAETSDDGLLIDKYRSCSLSTIFGNITSDVVQIIEAGKLPGA
ncbi:cytosolic fe-S cluster assembly factor CFD1 [Physcia stellaris]|nr:cytosolic fe-S cluster assembly factor CFD1 [Physcia stellaris]